MHKVHFTSDNVSFCGMGSADACGSKGPANIERLSPTRYKYILWKRRRPQAGTWNHRPVHLNGEPTVDVTTACWSGHKQKHQHESTSEPASQSINRQPCCLQWHTGFHWPLQGWACTPNFPLGWKTCRQNSAHVSHQTFRLPVSSDSLGFPSCRDAQQGTRVKQRPACCCSQALRNALQLGKKLVMSLASLSDCRTATTATNWAALLGHSVEKVESSCNFHWFSHYFADLI